MRSVTLCAACAARRPRPAGPKVRVLIQGENG